jgi:hypothetical protein
MFDSLDRREFLKAAAGAVTVQAGASARAFAFNQADAGHVPDIRNLDYGASTKDAREH